MRMPFKGLYLGILFFFVCVSSMSSQNQWRIDSLEKLVNLNICDSNQGKVFYYLADEYSKVNFERAAVTLQKALLIFKKIKNRDWEANAMNSLGIIYGKKGNYEGSLNCFNQYLQIFNKPGDFEQQGTAYGNMGLVYMHLGNYGKSAEYFLKALKNSEENHDTIRMSGVLNNLGNLYRFLKDFNASLNYMRQSLLLRKLMKKENLIGSSYAGIGATYLEIEKYDSALYYFRIACNIQVKSKDKLLIAALYDNLAVCFSSLGQNDSTMKYLALGMGLNKSIGNASGILAVSMSYAKHFYQNKNYIQAIDYLEDALPVAIATKQNDDLKDFYEMLGKCYYCTKNYSTASTYFYSYDTLSEALSKINSAQKIENLQTNFIIEKNQREIEKLSQKQVIQNLAIEKQGLELKRQRMGLWMSVLLALLALGFIYSLWKSNKQKKSDNYLLSRQKEIIEIKNKEVTDSINYARRIQMAILTGKATWNQIGTEHFILFRPKDIVSGDFYWSFISEEGYAIWAVADCTGHGVPGGFMSMLGNSFLNSIVVENKIIEPSEILNRLREKVIHALEQQGGGGERDGMDIALCFLDAEKMELKFAGANNGITIVRQQEMIDLKPDKMPIGHYPGEAKRFCTKTLALKKSDMIYMTSDGFPDQFGGQNGKKFKYRRLENELLNIHTESAEKQKSHLEKTFTGWKGSLEQVDDVLIVGVRV